MSSRVAAIARKRSGDGSGSAGLAGRGLAEERLGGGRKLCGAQALREYLELLVHATCHLGLLRGLHQALGGTDGPRGLTGRGIGQSPSLLDQGLIFYDTVDEPPLLGGLRIERLTEEESLSRPAMSEEPRQQQRARGLRNDPELHERHDESGAAGGGDNQVAVQQQRGADPDGRTVNGGNENLAESADRTQESRDHMVGLNDRRRIQEIPEVVASCEACAFATQQDHAQLFVRLSLCQS